MCGIAGVVGRSDRPIQGLTDRAAAMANAQRHRGPDAGGIWTCPQGPVVFAHRRLAIIDLTAAGQQPMASADGRQVVVYNGETYNFEEVRSAFPDRQQPCWRGHSDTEVLVESIVRWGLGAAVQKFNGMFAFAVWSEPDRTVSLVRDRMGVKPLFVARAMDGALIFASESRALAADPRFEAKLNRDALPSYFTFGYLPRTHCVYCDTVSLAPGSMVTFAADAVAVDWAGFHAVAQANPDGPFDLRGRGWHYRTYWSAVESWRKGADDRFTGNLEEASGAVEELLSDAVKIRMVSDVPLGALLSGGVDSSLVVAIMQRLSRQQVHTFSIGFEDEEFDESGHAAAVARHLGTQHTELRLGRAEALRTAANLGQLLDEPLADSSFIPTYLVSELTRQHVKVAMTGDGGDELFGGYWRYRNFRHLRLAHALPRRIRQLADVIGRRVEIQPPFGRGLSWAWYRTARLLRLASQPDFATAYRYAVTMTFPGARLLRDWSEAAIPRFPPQPLRSMDLAEAMMHFDTLNVLPDDLLAKVDRASMAVALECREPLLDFRLHEFSARLPLKFKLEPGAGKRVLREALYRHVPRALIDRPKQGFGVPLQRWLREDLRDCVEQTLFAGDRSSDLFYDVELRKVWNQHQSGQRDYRGVLWRTYVLKKWLAGHRWS